MKIETYKDWEKSQEISGVSPESYYAENAWNHQQITIDALRKDLDQERERADKVEDSLRWRKWPEERPPREGFGYAIVSYGSEEGCTFSWESPVKEIAYWNGQEFECSMGFTHWLPIPPIGEDTL